MLTLPQLPTGPPNPPPNSGGGGGGRGGGNPSRWGRGGHSGGSGGGHGGGDGRGGGNPPPAPPAGNPLNPPVPGNNNNYKLSTPDPYEGKEDLDTYNIWKHKVSHFAEYYNIADDAIVKMFSKFISGKAKVWYLWYVVDNPRNWMPNDVFNGIFNHCFPANY